MADTSAWWRTGAGVAVWLVLAIATAGVAWAAVGVVADQGQGAVTVGIPAATRTTGPTPTPAPSSVGPSPSGSPSQTGDDQSLPGPSSQVLGSPGGVVSVVCTGSRSIRLIYATPADGWQFTVDKSGPDEIRVEFVRGDQDLRTRARCEAGGVQGRTESD